MRKKGYQKDGRSYYTNKPTNSFPIGHNKTIEQFLADIDKEYDIRAKLAKKSYEELKRVLAKHNDWSADEIKQYCRDYMLWDVKFDRNSNPIPLQIILKNIEKERERTKESRAYTYVKRITHKDNQKFVYNSGGCGDNHHKVRIPSLKRSKSVWKRFYELFPYYKEHFNELQHLKLKKVW